MGGLKKMDDEPIVTVWIQIFDLVYCTSQNADRVMELC